MRQTKPPAADHAVKATILTPCVSGPRQCRRPPSKSRWRYAYAFLLTLLMLGIYALPSWAAVGCDLNDPDRDVPRLFKESTGYKSVYLTIRQKGGEALLHRIEARLGEKYLALYVPLDIPYTLYEVYHGDRKVGYIHGVNQKGQFGGIQVFIAQDLNGKVKSFYIQKITGRSALKFRDAKFAGKMVGLSLRDFDTFDPATGKGTGRLAQLQNPAPEMETDFYGVLRGLKKNMVLMDEFVFSGNGGKP
jgi:hypothetical protein